MALSYTTLLVSFLFTAPAPTGDAQRLQGTWNVVEAVVNGKTATEGALKGAKVVFAGNKMTLISLVPINEDKPERIEDRREFTFKLDPSKTPKAIDVKAENGPFKKEMHYNPSIYSLEGDTLKLCLPNKTTKRRPTEFKSEEKSDLVLMVLKKAAR